MKSRSSIVGKKQVEKKGFKLFFDFETTGLDPVNDRIVEYAFVLMDGEREVCRSSNIVRSDVPICDEASEVNGITQKDIDNSGMSQVDMVSLFLSILKLNPLLIAHNLNFDFQFLYYTIYRLSGQNGVDYHLRGCNVLDTLTIARDRTYYAHRLETLINRFNLNAVNSHKALDDVYALIELYKYLKKDRDDLENYINLIGYYPKYGLNGVPLYPDRIVYLPQPWHNERATISKTLYRGAETLIKQLRGELK